MDEYNEYKHLDQYIETLINDQKSKNFIFIREEAQKLKSSLHINQGENEENNFKQLINYILLKKAEMIIAKNKKIIADKKLIII